MICVVRGGGRGTLGYSQEAAFALVPFVMPSVTLSKSFVLSGPQLPLCGWRGVAWIIPKGPFSSESL